MRRHLPQEMRSHESNLRLPIPWLNGNEERWWAHHYLTERGAPPRFEALARRLRASDPRARALLEPLLTFSLSWGYGPGLTGLASAWTSLRKLREPAESFRDAIARRLADLGPAKTHRTAVHWAIRDVLDPDRRKGLWDRWASDLAVPWQVFLESGIPVNDVLAGALEHEGTRAAILAFMTTSQILDVVKNNPTVAERLGYHFARNIHEIPLALRSDDDSAAREARLRLAGLLRGSRSVIPLPSQPLPGEGAYWAAAAEAIRLDPHKESYLRCIVFARELLHWTFAVQTGFEPATPIARAKAAIEYAEDAQRPVGARPFEAQELCQAALLLLAAIANDPTESERARTIAERLVAHPILLGAGWGGWYALKILFGEETVLDAAQRAILTGPAEQAETILKSLMSHECVALLDLVNRIARERPTLALGLAKFMDGDGTRSSALRATEKDPEPLYQSLRRLTGLWERPTTVKRSPIEVRLAAIRMLLHIFSDDPRAIDFLRTAAPALRRFHAAEGRA
ncbi:MAG: hypothetical protein ACRELB_20485, partial [Polyangiaceae bacterium]